MKTYKTAIIGVGKAGGGGPKGGGHAIGYTHAKMYQQSPRCALAAGVDVNAENLKFFQEKFNVPSGFSDTGKMLAEIRPDIVSIATYVGLHRGFIEQCARAGVKGILCEKPFVDSPWALSEVHRIVRETGVKIVVAHARRYCPGFQRAKQIIQSGAIGTPLMFFSGIENWDLSEWGSHWLDMFRYFNDDRPIKWVMGQARVTDQRGYGHLMEDHAVAYFEFDNDLKCLLDGGRGYPVKDLAMTLVGSAGTLRVFGHAAHRIELDLPGGRSVETLPNVWEPAWDEMLKDLIAWIEGGEPALAGFPRVAGSAELNLAAYVSALRGDRVDLPLKADDIAQWPLDLIAKRNQA